MTALRRTCSCLCSRHLRRSKKFILGLGSMKMQVRNTVRMILHSCKGLTVMSEVKCSLRLLKYLKETIWKHCMKETKARKNARTKCRTKSSSERGVYSEKLAYTSPRNTQKYVSGFPRFVKTKHRNFVLLQGCTYFMIFFLSSAHAWKMKHTFRKK